MRLLNTHESAEQLAVSERTVRRLIARGDLPAVRVGRTVRVSQDALDAFIKTHTTAAAS